MAGPQKPPIQPPKKVEELKSGEEHIAWGCIMLVGGIALMAGIIYMFRGFFFAEGNALYVVAVLFLGSGVIRQIMFMIEKSKKKQD
ncbi:MAG TPA: hypothetical protein VEK08_10285 [Planctomycetota bacterium]|nr:hypothetical protein [Planctomycetota bacterium]